MDDFYSTSAWLSVRARVLERDGHSCTVSRILGGSCSGVLAVHHIQPRCERPDLALDEDNLGTCCVRHHPKWEAVARALRLATGAEIPPCPHQHTYASGRRACEERRRRRILERRLSRVAA